MTQQSSYPVELRVELLKDESLKDDNMFHKWLGAEGSLTVKIAALMDIWMPILYICTPLELSDCNLSIGTDLMRLIYEKMSLVMIIIFHKLQWQFKIFHHLI